MIINRFSVKNPELITYANLPIPEDIRLKAVKDILDIKDQQDKKTNAVATMSSWQLWKEIDIGYILDYIFTFLNDVSVLPWNNSPIAVEHDDQPTSVITDLWSVVYEKGDYTKPHNHRPSSGSFVYYLNVTDKSSPLVFDECNFSVSPENNCLVVFPSNIIHSVPPLESDEKRIVIAGNFVKCLKHDRMLLGKNILVQKGY
jgi:hypothetical protein